MREGKRFVASSSLFSLVKLSPASQSSRRIEFYKRQELNYSTNHLFSGHLSPQFLRVLSPGPCVKIYFLSIV